MVGGREGSGVSQLLLPSGQSVWPIGAGTSPHPSVWGRVFKGQGAGKKGPGGDTPSSSSGGGGVALRKVIKDSMRGGGGGLGISQLRLPSPQYSFRKTLRRDPLNE